VNPRDTIVRYGEHAIRVIVAKVLLGREGKAREVGDRFDVFGAHARFVEFTPIHRRVLVGVRERPFEAFELQRGKFVAAGRFDTVERKRSGHGMSPS
jgi:hypothetical protein